MLENQVSGTDIITAEDLNNLLSDIRTELVNFNIEKNELYDLVYEKINQISYYEQEIRKMNSYTRGICWTYSSDIENSVSENTFYPGDYVYDSRYKVVFPKNYKMLSVYDILKGQNHVNLFPKESAGDKIVAVSPISGKQSTRVSVYSDTQEDANIVLYADINLTGNFIHLGFPGGIQKTIRVESNYYNSNLIISKKTMNFTEVVITITIPKSYFVINENKNIKKQYTASFVIQNIQFANIDTDRNVSYKVKMKKYASDYVINKIAVNDEGSFGGSFYDSVQLDVASSELNLQNDEYIKSFSIIGDGLTNTNINELANEEYVYFRVSLFDNTAPMIISSANIKFKIR